MKIHGPILRALLIPHCAAAQVLNCNLDGYKPVEGLTATVHEGVLEVKWRGERAQQLRAEFAIQNDQPIVRELASRISGANWIVLGRDLAPEFQVTSGVRRLATAQAEALRHIHGALTPDLIEREKWNAFWDAPLSVPGNPRAGDSSIDLPRRSEEIRCAGFRWPGRSRTPQWPPSARGRSSNLVRGCCQRDSLSLEPEKCA